MTIEPRGPWHSRTPDDSSGLFPGARLTSQVHAEGEFAIVSFDDFRKLDCRAGRVLEAEPFPEGRYSTHVLRIDFGPELGVKKSLARLAPNYVGPELVGRMVLAVVNFPPRQIGPHMSEVLTIGVPDTAGHTVLIQPDRDVPLGARLH